jgi:hypothetical protein
MSSFGKESVSGDSAVDSAVDSERAMGLDTALHPSPSAPILGPVEYVFKVSTSAPLEKDGISVRTDAAHSTPFISFIGNVGETEPIRIKYGLQAGNHSEFSAIAKDVGSVKAIRLGNPDTPDTWVPIQVALNRLGASSAPSQPTKPDGWISFKVGESIGIPKIFQQVISASDEGTRIGESPLIKKN